MRVWERTSRRKTGKATSIVMNNAVAVWTTLARWCGDDGEGTEVVSGAL